MLEIRCCVPDCPFVRVSSETVPCLLKRNIMRSEIQSVLLSDEGEAVGGCIARILQIVLAELLSRGHVERTNVYV